MTFKITDEMIIAAGNARDQAVAEYIKKKYSANTASDFFDIGNAEDSLGQFVAHLQEREIFDKDLIENLVQRILANNLHPIQCLRLSQIINDPDEELDFEDKKALIEQTLNVSWSPARPN